jgi:cysteine desulfurase
MFQAVYLDHNATTPVRPQVAALVAEALSVGGNPSAQHRFGRLARRMIEDARDAVAALVGAPTHQVIFTGGGTEANALAVRGCGRRRVLASAIEHASVLKAAAVETVPVGRNGIVDLEALDRMLAASAEPALVSVMLANNETGVIQPVAEAARVARRHGALVHCDAVQAAGKIPVDMPTLAVDFLTVSAHKLGGPAGVGALVLADEAPLSALVEGGGQERGLRGGTENLPGIAGFGAAAREALAFLDRFGSLEVLRERLETGARALLPDLEIAGGDAVRLPNASCLLAPGLKGETLAMALDLAGVAVGTGAACSSGNARPSPVLRAMGYGEAEAASAIRVSLGWTTGPEDVERFLLSWGDVLARAAGRSAAAA